VIRSFGARPLLSSLVMAFALMAADTHGGFTIQAPTVTEILERYSRGESVDEALTPYLQTSAAVRGFLRDLERQAPTIAAPLVAAFALHAANLAFEHTPLEFHRGDSAYALAILEVGCGTLRRASKSPTDFEVRWQVLAADLITSSTRRKGGSAETFNMDHLASAYGRHFEHVLGRHRSDPQLALSWARHEQARFYVWRLTWGVAVVRAQHELPRRLAVRRLEVVVDTLAPLRSQPEFADEARVRSSDALLHLGRSTEALQLLSQGPARDPNWEYIRRLIRGRYFVQRGQADDAGREYNAAILIDPEARQANLALAGLAYLAGQHEVADRLTTAATDASGPDRWVAYMYPGRTDLNARLAALREDARGAR
jgi:tetratricopeptide (TPR) repeat protein